MISKSQTKYIQSLQYKKFRDESGLFIAEGPKVVMDLLKGGKFACKELFAVTGWLNANAELKAASHETSFVEIEGFELQKISALATANNVLAVFEKRKEDGAIRFEGKITLALDTVQDPGNFGTIIRIADWFGVETIICSRNCADMYNPKVVQSSMGSLGRVNILYDELTSLLKSNKNIKIYAAGLQGRDVDQLRGIKEGMIIIGNESKGISDEVIALADEMITIPKIGEAESLNAAVAAGIILSHL